MASTRSCNCARRSAIWVLLGERGAQRAESASTTRSPLRWPSCMPSANAVPRITSTKPADDTQRERVREIQLPRLPSRLRKENQVHAAQLAWKLTTDMATTRLAHEP